MPKLPGRSAIKSADTSSPAHRREHQVEGDVGRTGGKMAKRKNRHKNDGPETAEEWLGEAVSREESGDRWVRQDPVKAGRFYAGAGEAYARCLALDPTLFDAAFNRARLLLHLSESCALLEGPRLEAVTASVVAHRELLSRWPASADGRYNTAMALMSFAELVQEEREAAAALGEALDLLRQCRLQQTAELDKMRADGEEGESSEIGVDESAGGTASDPVATVNGIGEVDGNMDKHDQGGEEEEDGQQMDVDVNYISADILFDTLIAVLEVFTQLLELDPMPEETLLREAERFVQQEVVPQMDAVGPSCLAADVRSRRVEALHAVRLATMECAHRRGTLTLADYRAQVGAYINDTASPATEGSVAMLCANVDAYISLSGALRSDPSSVQDAWTVLTAGAGTQIAKAIAASTASAVEDKRRLPALYVTRADIELLRASLPLDVAARNRATLWRNAVVYYARAVRESVLPRDTRTANEAALKGAIVSAEMTDPSSSSSSPLPAVPQMTKEEAQEIVSHARSDGIFLGPWRLLSS